MGVDSMHETLAADGYSMRSQKNFDGINRAAGRHTRVRHRT
ncbi:hypothetical protein BURPS305_3005 [Burkholderia pseudomallei 305]|uniref:Uncharacterized protein n=1 Tax=Burkholderia pseudomallei 1710a TaxID=320371 RepID=A0A0E1WBP3_BURPE|nr:hypothetical protein GBP346_A4273 [Burkholderia pseudomallei MSHR346]EBA47089.1 hypothetical protein BURPS305_3005 [Burkholderia pseudomallei 305]EEH30741.1 hypothetical protein BUH_4195 [Burkholderia pseudomallei Pakistan 9]EET06957.1 hypothetical protein BURPS1710A_0343 [Burkholderia pseudomallei 1710a]